MKVIEQRMTDMTTLYLVFHILGFTIGLPLAHYPSMGECTTSVAADVFGGVCVNDR
jgi:hypothetical protein